MTPEKKIESTKQSFLAKNESDALEKKQGSISDALGFDVSDVNPEDINDKGFEDINASNMAIPFIKVLQKGSPQVEKKNKAYIDGAEPGLFYNSVTNELYGESIDVIILKFEHMFIEWKPIDDGGGLVGIHTPANADRIASDKTVFNKWKTAEGNELQENYAYLILIKGKEQEGVALLPLTGSNIKPAKKMNRELNNTLLDNGTKAKQWMITWKLTSVYSQNDQFTWYSMEPKRTGFLNSKGQFLAVVSERKALPDVNQASNLDQLEGPQQGTSNSKQIEREV